MDQVTPNHDHNEHDEASSSGYIRWTGFWGTVGFPATTFLQIFSTLTFGLGILIGAGGMTYSFLQQSNLGTCTQQAKVSQQTAPKRIPQIKTETSVENQLNH